MDFTLHPIGVVRSPYITKNEAPSQGRFSENISEIIIDKQYLPGLFRVDELKYLFILCWFDQSDRSVLRVIPPHNPTERGVFASRSPDRPNPVSLSLVELIDMNEDGILRVKGLEALDGTPVLDIKLYSEGIDCIPAVLSHTS
jgi:tRNA (adenine37-N6)-methyltransferase